MSNENIRPTTLSGVKRLAKSIKVEGQIQHTQALDLAAKAAGFQNFKHARKMLPAINQGQQKRNRLFLTKYWSDKESGKEGRETLTLFLDSDWSETLSPTHFKYHRSLWDFRKEGPDHLANRYMGSSQSKARSEICAAARVLQFIDATKLRPARSKRAYPEGKHSNIVPGNDHSSVWYDSATKRYLFVDEPYVYDTHRNAAEREAWALKHGYTIVESLWPGMYFPEGGSRLYLISDLNKGVSLPPIISALNNLPSPIVESTWDGESAALLPFFVSPGTIELHETNKKLAETSKGAHTTKAPRNTVGYVQTFVGRQRRPKGKMPIKSHEQVGKLLKSVLAASFMRKGVYNRLNSVRSDLDEWVQREYTHEELPDEQFFDLYYHDTGSSFERTVPLEQRNQHIKTLEKVKKILASHYPHCAPLTSLQKKLESAIKSMQNWIN